MFDVRRVDDEYYGEYKDVRFKISEDFLKELDYGCDIFREKCIFVVFENIFTACKYQNSAKIELYKANILANDYLLFIIFWCVVFLFYIKLKV